MTRLFVTSPSACSCLSVCHPPSIALHQNRPFKSSSGGYRAYLCVHCVRQPAPKLHPLHPHQPRGFFFLIQRGWWGNGRAATPTCSPSRLPHSGMSTLSHSITPPQRRILCLPLAHSSSLQRSQQHRSLLSHRRNFSRNWYIQEMLNNIIQILFEVTMQEFQHTTTVLLNLPNKSTVPFGKKYEVDRLFGLMDHIKWCGMMELASRLIFDTYVLNTVETYRKTSAETAGALL